jgi:hypothetical protein
MNQFQFQAWEKKTNNSWRIVNTFQKLTVRLIALKWFHFHLLFYCQARLVAVFEQVVNKMCFIVQLV